jgi:tetratricopeptide (TPR) repeat protein
MKRGIRFATVTAAAALVAAAALPAIAAKKAAVDPSGYWNGKSPVEAADAVLAAAKSAAGRGSWENIAVARVWYLAGQKEKAKPILEQYGREGTKEASDLYRIGRVHCEAKEYELALATFDRAMALEPESDKTLVAMGACAMMAGDREKAEGYFRRALEREPNNPWRLAAVGAAYLGVMPNLD